ncbi:AN1-type zinc finger protein 6-like isoform X2 [Dreissena polymorpha]|uniref:AN1-type zinc finger protein 6-like isoform X2 n=1 Tax=Dreissena polymorpha TaxID=45954 RepID=UPI0022640E64|nr:AN1-type zinc finger protein 6-like isoform X2 [Dreissena polymorpha]
MEQNNPNLPPVTFCRSGCGFYGNESFEGMCSKCFRDQLKRKQQSSSPVSPAGRASPGASAGTTFPVQETGSSSSSNTSVASGSTIPSVETATPTIPVSPSNGGKEEGATASAAPSDNSPESGKDKKKRNRCNLCKKKVGLTGFECRCGGMFCSLHRYSDKHDCTFNYREHAQEQIRKNNPVIVGEKIQKI